jgi:cell division protein ZapA
MATEAVLVHILGKDYQVACPAEERDALLRAAIELDKRMRDIRQSGNVIGVERIAVMAALNLANEVLQSRTSLKKSDQGMIEDLHRRLDKVLP